jgi:3-mercaptopyruvate sulfurtransferase SseA
MGRRKAQQNRNFMIFVIAGGVLLLASAALLILSSQQAQVAPEAAATVAGDPIAGFPRITLEESKTAFDNSSAIFLDVRTQQEFDQAHIPGSVLIPYAELSERLGELDPQATYITYCT